MHNDAPFDTGIKITGATGGATEALALSLEAVEDAAEEEIEANEDEEEEGAGAAAES